jgi:hypothetical protein
MQRETNKDNSILKVLSTMTVEEIGQIEDILRCYIYWTIRGRGKGRDGLLI